MDAIRFGIGITDMEKKPDRVVRTSLENHSVTSLLLFKDDNDLFWDDLKRKMWLRFQFTNLNHLYTYQEMSSTRGSASSRWQSQ